MTPGNTRAQIALGLLCCILTRTAHAQVAPPAVDNGNRLNNPFRTQFRPAWNLAIQDPVKLVDVGAVTDAKRPNLVLLVAGQTPADTQRRLRVTHWNGNSYDLDSEAISQSIGIDTLLIGRFHPGGPVAVPVVKPSDPKPAAGADAKKPAKPPKPRPNVTGKFQQVLTNSGIYSWTSSTLEPVFARQLPDVKQSIILDNRLDMVVVGAGDGSLPFEFTQTEMRPATKEKLQGNGYARFGIGLQSFPGSDNVVLAPGIRYVQSVWSGRTRWLIGLVRGRPAGTVQDPAATTGDRLVVFTPKLRNREKSFWESRMDDLEESWRSEPLAGRVLDVRVGDPHNDGKLGILVLTAENEDKQRRLTFFAPTGNG